MKRKKNKVKKSGEKSRRVINIVLLVMAFVVTIGLIATNGTVVSTTGILSVVSTL